MCLRSVKFKFKNYQRGMTILMNSMTNHRVVGQFEPQWKGTCWAPLREGFKADVPLPGTIVQTPCTLGSMVRKILTVRGPLGLSLGGPSKEREWDSKSYFSDTTGGN